MEEVSLTDFQALMILLWLSLSLRLLLCMNDDRGLIVVNASAVSLQQLLPDFPSIDETASGGRYFLIRSVLVVLPKLPRG